MYQYINGEHSHLNRYLELEAQSRQHQNKSKGSFEHVLHFFGLRTLLKSRQPVEMDLHSIVELIDLPLSTLLETRMEILQVRERIPS